MRTDPDTLDLTFDDERTQSVGEAEALFERWVRLRNAADAPRSRHLRASSVRVYRTMWKKFVRYLVETRRTVANVSAREIERSLARKGRRLERVPNALTQWRYLKLLAEILDLVRSDGARHDNPAQELLADRDHPARDAPPVTLNQGDEALVRLALDEQRKESGDWKDLRDWALLQVVLGCGLKPFEVRRLAVTDLRWKDPAREEGEVTIAVAGHAPAPPREVPVAPRACEPLALWMRARRRAGVTSPALFPIDEAGPEHVGPSEVYRACAELLKRANVATSRRGVGVLRATFAVLQLEKGRTEDQVAAWMGLAQPSSIERYRPRNTARSGRPV